MLVTPEWDQPMASGLSDALFHAGQLPPGVRKAFEALTGYGFPEEGSGSTEALTGAANV
jgi:hypothetical protein